MTSEKLETAIQLIASGNRQAAVPVLRTLIQENNANEDAWLLLSTCMDDVEQKKFCLQSVLTINPANQEAREALDALTHPEPAPVEFSWSQPETLRWDEPSSADEIVLERTAPEKIERKKMEWEQTESELLAQEQAEREKAEQKRLEREKAELERVETLKMEWEKTESEHSEKEKAERQRKPEAASAAIPKIDWDAWDIEEPASAKPLKQKPVKVTYQSTPYRKPRRDRRALFSLLAMMVLFLMSFTVCMVFVAQLVTP